SLCAGEVTCIASPLSPWGRGAEGEGNAAKRQAPHSRQNSSLPQAWPPITHPPNAAQIDSTLSSGRVQRFTDGAGRHWVRQPVRTGLERRRDRPPRCRPAAPGFRGEDGNFLFFFPDP